MIRWQHIAIISLIINIHFVATLFIDLHMQKEVSEKTTVFASASAGKVLESYITSNDSFVRLQLAKELPLKIEQIKKDVFISWSPYSYLHVFPTESLMKEFWDNVYDAWIYLPNTTEVISKEQQSQRVRILYFLQTGVNSLAFGMILSLFVAPFFYIFRGKKRTLIG